MVTCSWPHVLDALLVKVASSVSLPVHTYRTYCAGFNRRETDVFNCTEWKLTMVAESAWMKKLGIILEHSGGDVFEFHQIKRNGKMLAFQNTTAKQDLGNANSLSTSVCQASRTWPSILGWADALTWQKL